MSTTFASLRTRAIAFALDYIIIAAYLALVAAVGWGGNAWLPDIIDRAFSGPISGQITGFLLVTLPISAYFVLSESSTRQATWGKQKKGLCVTRKDGGRLSIPQALGRTALKFLPWELAHTCVWQMSFAPQEPPTIILAALVLVWVLVGANVVSLWHSPYRQTLYDRLAQTCVIQR